MANYFYVKSGYGTNVGATPFTSKQTGAFSGLAATSCYDSLLDLSGVAVGDFILVSHVHNKVYATETSFNVAGGYGLIAVYSVDDSNCESYKKGAHEEVTTGDFYVNGETLRQHYTITGISFKALAGNLHIDCYHTLSNLEDCTLYASGHLNLSSKSKKGYIKNCVITCAYISAFDANFEYVGGSISVTNFLSSCNGASRHSNVDFRGSSPTAYLVGDSGIRSAYRQEFNQCMLPTNYRVREPSTYSYLYDVVLNGCDEYFSFARYNRYSEIKSTTNLYLNYKYDDVNSLSVLVSSLSLVNNSLSVSYKLCEIPAQDLSATDKTYRVNLLLDADTVAKLSDSDFWIEVSHSNNTDLALGNIVSSRNTDILAIGTELTASTETWLGTLPTNTKAYQVDITLSAASLTNVTNGNVIVYANLATPNTDVYVCPAIQIGT